MIELKGQLQTVKTLKGNINRVPASENNTYILVDENGYEIPAVVVEEKTVFTATENDIRLGTVAATEKGVTVGTLVVD